MQVAAGRLRSSQLIQLFKSSIISEKRHIFINKSIIEEVRKLLYTKHLRDD